MKQASDLTARLVRGVRWRGRAERMECKKKIADGSPSTTSTRAPCEDKPEACSGTKSSLGRAQSIGIESERE
eukprot:2438644-Rhodomonas_salina.1